MDKIELKLELMKCGFIENPRTHKWAKAEINTKYGYLPSYQTQYIDYDTSYQIARIKKMK